MDAIKYPESWPKGVKLALNPSSRFTINDVDLVGVDKYGVIVDDLSHPDCFPLFRLRIFDHTILYSYSILTDGEMVWGIGHPIKGDNYTIQNLYSTHPLPASDVRIAISFYVSERQNEQVP
jgi:hypothetical protein